MTAHKGQRVGYIRVSSVGQNSERQLAGVQLDRTFEDKASGKDTHRPQLDAMLKHVRAGDTVLCHSMDRMARNLVDLRKLIDDLTGRGVAVEFVKEKLTFTGEDSPMANLLLSVMGGVAEFERATIRERQMEGVAIAKAAGRYRGGVQKLKAEQVEALRARVAVGVPIAKVAREFELSRQSVYTYLKPTAEVQAELRTRIGNTLTCQDCDMDHCTCDE